MYGHMVMATRTMFDVEIQFECTNGNTCYLSYDNKTVDPTTRPRPVNEILVGICTFNKNKNAKFVLFSLKKKITHIINTMSNNSTCTLYLEALRSNK